MGNLYTKLKIFHFNNKIVSLPRENSEILAPLHIRIKPTNICNHNCSYCAYRAESLQLGKDMKKTDMIPQEKALEIIEDIIDMGVKAVTFSGGGEPLLYSHLAEVLKRLAASPVKFAALTNGSRLEGEIAELLAHQGTWVRVSMDGWDNASYAEYRRISIDEFDKVIGNMQKFKKLGGPCRLGISIIVDQKNVVHLYEFIKKMKDVGVDSVKISPCIISNHGEENNRYHEPIFAIGKEQIQRSIEDLQENNFEIFDSYHELETKFSKDYSWCPYLQILPVIGADLNIYPCQDKAYNIQEGLLGSIEQQRFKEFWFSDKNLFFKINPSIHCNHHCVANQKNRLLHEYMNADNEHLGFV